MFGVSRVRQKVLDLDWHLLVAAGALIAVGLSFIWSASLNMDKLQNGFSSQVSRILLSSPFLLAGWFVDLQWLRRNAYLVYATTILLLLGIFFFGLEKNNSRRWFAIGGSFLIQPSEFAKLGLIFALAKLVMYRRKLERFEGIVLALTLLGLPLILILKQPDLGTGLVLLPITFAMLFVAGAKKRHLIGLGLTALILAPTGYFVLKPYQRERVDVWLRQDSLTAQEKRNQGYHLYNAKISIGSGGWFGKGLGKGPQNQLDALPERHTDFIAALIGEEAGLFGSAAVLSLYLLFVILIFFVAMRTREPFGRLLVVGIGAYFMTHLFVNVGVATGFLPTTGVTLPLISYGGSSVMTAFAALGLVLNVSSRRETDFGEEAFDNSER